MKHLPHLKVSKLGKKKKKSTALYCPKQICLRTRNGWQLPVCGPYHINTYLPIPGISNIPTKTGPPESCPSTTETWKSGNFFKRNPNGLFGNGETTSISASSQGPVIWCIQQGGLSVQEVAQTLRLSETSFSTCRCGFRCHENCQVEEIYPSIHTHKRPGGSVCQPSKGNGKLCAFSLKLWENQEFNTSVPTSNQSNIGSLGLFYFEALAYLRGIKAFPNWL